MLFQHSDFQETSVAKNAKYPRNHLLNCKVSLFLPVTADSMTGAGLVSTTKKLRTKGFCGATKCIQKSTNKLCIRPILCDF